MTGTCFWLRFVYSGCFGVLKIHWPLLTALSFYRFDIFFRTKNVNGFVIGQSGIDRGHDIECGFDRNKLQGRFAERACATAQIGVVFVIHTVVLHQEPVSGHQVRA